MYRAAIIGLGNAGWKYDIDKFNQLKSHSFAIRNHLEWEIAFGIDPKTPERNLWSDCFQKPSFAVISEERIEISPDFVVIATPPQFLVQSTLSALKYFPTSKILLEKPAATSTQDLEYLSRLSDEQQCQIVINYPRLFAPESLQLKKFVENINVNSKLLAFCGTYSGGFLNTIGHALSFLQYLFPSVEFTFEGDFVDSLGRPSPNVLINFGSNFGQLKPDPKAISSTFSFEVEMEGGSLIYKDGGESCEIVVDGRRESLPSTRDTYQWNVYDFIAHNSWDEVLKISGLNTQLSLVRDIVDAHLT